MIERRATQSNEDPVCGMTVDRDIARATGLVVTHEGMTFNPVNRPTMQASRTIDTCVGASSSSPQRSVSSATATPVDARARE